MPESLRVRVLKTLPELEEIRAHWESWPGNRDSDIDSFLAFLHTSRDTLRPHVIVVEREGHPDAILVGRIDRAHISCRFGYLRLNLPATVLVFVYGAFRGQGSVENAELVVDCVLRSLRAREADAAYMNFLRADSELCRLARQKPGSLFRDYLRPSQRHFATALPAKVDDFYRTLSPKARSTEKRKAKKLEAEFGGDVQIRCFREVSEVEELAVMAERLASKSYQRGLGVGFFDTPTMRASMKLKAEHGWLRGYVLYLGGEASAFWIGDVNEQTFGSDYLAFDPAFGKHSPGMYLVLKVIEGFCDDSAERIAAIDFGPGHAQYKEVLSTEEWLETAIYIFGPGVKGLALNIMRTLVGGTDHLVKDLLTRTNLLQKIKKAWRTRVTREAALQT